MVGVAAGAAAAAAISAAAGRHAAIATRRTTHTTRKVINRTTSELGLSIIGATNTSDPAGSVSATIAVGAGAAQP